MAMKKNSNLIKIIILVIVIVLVSSVPISLKTKNIIWHETVKADDSYAYFIQIGGTWCSRLYTDVQIEGDVCEIHVKGALASLSRVFGSKRLPAADFINDPNQIIKQIYVACSDGKLLIYDTSFGERYSQDYTEELINSEND